MSPIVDPTFKLVILAELIPVILLELSNTRAFDAEAVPAVIDVRYAASVPDNVALPIVKLVRVPIAVILV